jgi:hypothetical protein
MIIEYFRKILELPFAELVPRTIAYARRLNSYRRRRATDARRGTYSNGIPVGDLLSFVKIGDVSSLRPLGCQLAELSALYLDHRFDLLGSGWVKVRHGMVCRGIEGHRFAKSSDVIVDQNGHWLERRINKSNLKESQRVWSFVAPGYLPIDWQLDFKSGYRWSEDMWAQDVPFGHLPGVDIKLPWELARLQHLPQIAIAHYCSIYENEWNSGFLEQGFYVQEFRNVVLDFIATNPPRFGVNWRSAMDAGIRAANILLAYDIFRGSGVSFDVQFDELIKRSMLEHGEFIVEHFGWDHKPRGNHYLAHVSGLLFVSAYLPSTPLVDSWLALAIQELISETERQFNADGSNFEGSTSYHRLSGEMLIYAAALILGLPHEKQRVLNNYDHSFIKTRPFLRPAPLFSVPASEVDRIVAIPNWFRERIERCAEFSMRITKHSGDIVQIGDNDSGRFFRLLPAYNKISLSEAKLRYEHLRDFDERDIQHTWWDENILDHRHLVAAASGIVRRADFSEFAGCPFEGMIVSAIAKQCCFDSGSTHSGLRISSVDTEITDKCDFELILGYPGFSLLRNIKHHAYCDFGIFVFKSDRLFLSVRCGPVGQEGKGGHAHNDQLSIELEVDGKSIFVDPGSYIYTALPALRNRYRSDLAHASFRADNVESGNLDKGLFEIHGDPKAKCTRFEGDIFIGEHYGFGCKVRRLIKIDETAVTVRDWVASSDCHGLRIYPFYASKIATFPLFHSVGYGKKFRDSSQSLNLS